MTMAMPSMMMVMVMTHDTGDDDDADDDDDDDDDDGDDADDDDDDDLTGVPRQSVPRGHKVATRESHRGPKGVPTGSSGGSGSQGGPKKIWRDNKGIQASTKGSGGDPRSFFKNM